MTEGGAESLPYGRARRVRAGNGRRDEVIPPYGRATRVRSCDVSPSVKTFGFDTSLAEGGRGVPRLRARETVYYGALWVTGEVQNGRGQKALFDVAVFALSALFGEKRVHITTVEKGVETVQNLLWTGLWAVA